MYVAIADTDGSYYVEAGDGLADSGASDSGEGTAD